MILTRKDGTTKYTFGSMTDGTFYCFTLERPWLDNQEGISCIPCGTYTCKRVMSHHFGFEVFEVTNVPGRTHIEIHPANIVEQVEGCIAVGKEEGVLNGEFAVLESKIAFNEFMEVNKGVDTFQLTIEEL